MFEWTQTYRLPPDRDKAAIALYSYFRELEHAEIISEFTFADDPKDRFTIHVTVKLTRRQQMGEAKEPSSMIRTIIMETDRLLLNFIRQHEPKPWWERLREKLIP